MISSLVVMKRIFFVLFSVFLISFHCKTGAVYASDIYSVESVNPDNAYGYSVKRVGEKIKLFLLNVSPKSKADFYLKLIDRRFNELGYIASEKNLNYIEDASYRYFTHAGLLTEYLIEKDMDEKKESAVVIFRSHLPKLEKFRNGFDYDTAEWRLIQYDIDYLNTYLGMLSGEK